LAWEDQVILTVNEGAKANLTRLYIGQISNASATADGDGSTISVEQGLFVGGTLLLESQDQVDSEAVGELLIQQGGQVIAGESEALGTYIGSTARGIVTVDGEMGTARSKLEDHLEITVGVQGGHAAPMRDGTLKILNGGLVNTPQLTIASEPFSTGLLEVRGESAARNEVSTLNVSQFFEIGGGTIYDIDANEPGLAELLVYEGGKVAVMGDISIGRSNKAEVVVDGVSATNRDIHSTITAGMVQIGNGVSGKVWVQSGGDLHASTILIGNPPETEYENEMPDGELIITNGGLVTSQDLRMMPLRGSEGQARGTGHVYVGGFGALRASKLETKTFSIGHGYNLEIKEGGFVKSRDAEVFAGGEVLIGGREVTGGSTWFIENDLTLGGNFGNTSHLDVLADGVVTVRGSLSVNSGGIICLESGAIIRTDAVLDLAGLLSPGCIEEEEPVESSAFLTQLDARVSIRTSNLAVARIEGDVNLLATGLITMEIAGPEPENQDRLVVTGALTMNGTLHLIFSGHAPTQSEQLQLIDVGGNLTAENLNIQISGLKDGFQYSWAVSEGMFTLTAENDAAIRTADDPVQVFQTRYAPGGELVLPIFAVGDATYRFETSTDLETWELISETPGDNSLLELSNLPNLDQGRRFYRIVQVPVSPGN